MIKRLLQHVLNFSLLLPLPKQAIRMTGNGTGDEIEYVLTQPLMMQNKVNFFKQSTAGLNSKFSFYYIGCHTKVVIV